MTRDRISLAMVLGVWLLAAAAVMAVVVGGL